MLITNQNYPKQINVLMLFYLQVLMPKGRYSGQKLKILVATKTNANTKSIIPKIPEIVPVK